MLYDPIAHDDTHLAKHGFKFKPLDSHTYMQLDKHTGNIKQKEAEIALTSVSWITLV